MRPPLLNSHSTTKSSNLWCAAAPKLQFQMNCHVYISASKSTISSHSPHSSQSTPMHAHHIHELRMKWGLHLQWRGHNSYSIRKSTITACPRQSSSTLELQHLLHASVPLFGATTPPSRSTRAPRYLQANITSPTGWSPLAVLALFK